jgi:hypothetical protein
LSSTDICANKRRGADVNKFNLPESRANWQLGGELRHGAGWL